MNNEEIKIKALEWLQYRLRMPMKFNDVDIKITNVYVQLETTSVGLVIYFYWEDDLVEMTDFNDRGINTLMMTVDMVKELLDNKNPKNIKNKYLR
jgi:hypothetical protein